MSETIHVDEKFIMSRFEDAFVICGAFDGTPKTLSYPKRIEVAVQRVGPSEEKTGRSLQSLAILLRFTGDLTDLTISTMGTMMGISGITLR